MKKQSSLSIIIPVYNEQQALPRLLQHLRDLEVFDRHEVIIVDGGSTDDTLSRAAQYPCRLIQCSRARRSVQLNRGAAGAKNDILYLLHADALPPPAFDRLILRALEQGYPRGIFAFQFDHPSLLLRINAYFTRFKFLFSGGGDQSLFISKNDFFNLGGFDEQLSVLEDFDFFKRSASLGDFALIRKPLLVSARKYQSNSYFKVQIANLWALAAHRLGVDNHKIRARYERWMNSHRKSP